MDVIFRVWWLEAPPTSPDALPLLFVTALLAGYGGFYFKTNPLTLETTQTKHQHLNYFPFFLLLGHLL